MTSVNKKKRIITHLSGDTCLNNLNQWFDVLHIFCSIICILLLQMMRIIKHRSHDIFRFTSADNGTVQTVMYEQRQSSAMIKMCMTDEDCFDSCVTNLAGVLERIS